MNTFENTTSSQETSDENISFETAESMRTIDELQTTADDSIAKTTKYLDNPETSLTKENVGLLQSIGEKFKKSHLLKAAALGVTFMSAQPAFADNISMNLHPQNSHRLNVKASDFNNSDQINRVRINRLNQLRAPGLQPGQLSINGRNILSGQINHFQQKTLPNATINGGPAYEIAPGIYGDENTVYRQTSEGGTVLMGGISID